MKKVFIFALLIMGAFVLPTSCGDGKKANSTEAAETEENATEDEVPAEKIMVSDFRFADDELSEALYDIFHFVYHDYPLQINGNDISVTVRIHGDNDVSKDVLGKLTSKKVVMALFDDDYTEIGNKKLELVGMTIKDVYDWVVANGMEKKEITFECKDFDAVGKLKNLKYAKIFAVD